jgi:predicted dehydrogenase
MRDDHRPLKLAVVGCGMITESAHLPAALASADVEVVALVDPVVSRAHRLATKYGIRPQISPCIDDVLAGADAALIATPNHTHFPLAKQALSERKAVLVEKPLANSYAEAVELCELAERNETVLATGFVSRYRENLVLFKELLDSGFLGQVCGFNYQFGTAGGWAPASGYNLQRKQSGGGVLVVSGTHFLDRMLYLFGWPNQFAYEDDSRGGIEANCRATVFFSNSLGEFTGTIALSKTTTLTKRQAITTEQYECHLPEDNDMPLELHRRDLPHIVQKLSYGRQDWGDTFRLQLEDFAYAAQHGGRTKVDGRAGALCVKLVEEFYAQRVSMPEPWSLAMSRVD